LPNLDRLYYFEDMLKANDFVTVTIAWDRRVEPIDPGGDFEDGFEDFTDLDDVLNDLDIYLRNVEFDQKVDGSVSVIDNVEHIGFFVDEPGEYLIEVDHAGGIGDLQDYAIAWWAGEPVAGGASEDVDDDGDVDGEDFDTWKDSFGFDSGADADFDTDSDGADFLAWQSNFGAGVPAVSANSIVPEPAAWTLAAFGLSKILRRFHGKFVS
jgi:hypothetical protein